VDYKVDVPERYEAQGHGQDWTRCGANGGTIQIEAWIRECFFVCTYLAKVGYGIVFWGDIKIHGRVTSVIGV
jgi:hypothetical protein